MAPSAAGCPAPAVLAGDDDVRPAGQGAVLVREGFPGLAAHDHRVAGGEPGEVRHVLGKVPRHVAVLADHAGAGLRPDDAEAGDGGRPVVGEVAGLPARVLSLLIRLSGP